MSFSGMDVAAVEALSKQLNGLADRLAEIGKSVDRDVATMGNIWRGPDAQKFASSWSTHRASLNAAQDAVREVGAASLRNAQQQRATSAASGGAPAAPVTGHAPAAPAAPAAPPAAPPAGTSSGHGAVGQTTPGQLPPGDTAAYHAFEARSHHNAGVGYSVDANGAAQNNCTAWAQWRRDELGLSSPGGNGAQMAGNAGGTTHTPPSLGALVSFGEGAYGHVQVVEQIYPDGSFRVSETNYNGSSEVRTVEKWHPLPDGTWKNDSGKVRDLVISP